MKYKAVLFDMDGVILDSEPLHVAAFQTTLQGFGKNLTDEEYKSHFAGRTDEAGFRRYFSYINEKVSLPTVMDAKAKEYIRLARDQLVSYPGVEEIIKDIANQVPLALVTGSLRLEAEVALEALGLTHEFKFMITAEDVKNSKPDPEGYLRAAEKLGVAAEDCIVVEDSPSGVKAAQAAGVFCIAVCHTHSPEELSDASLVLDTLHADTFSSL